jgi:enediyne polyketide synthase
MLFHGRRFRRIAGYRMLTARDCVADIAPADGGSWFDDFLPATLLLGDPGARDAALHALQACIPHRRVLPVAVAGIDPGRLAMNEPYAVVGHERARDANQFIFDMEIRNAAGAPVERWSGLRLQAVEPLSEPLEWPHALAGAYLERRLEELLGEPVRVGLHEDGACDRASRRNAALALAGIDASTLFARPDGKPEMGRHDRWETVSVTHTPTLTLAVATSSGTVGCDLEAIEPRANDWRNLLGADRLALARLVSERTGEDFDTAATRVWSACECSRKANARPSAPLLLDDVLGSKSIMLRAGAATIASLVLTVRGTGRIAAAVSVAPQVVDIARPAHAEVK